MRSIFTTLLLFFSVVCYSQVHLLKELMVPGENTPTLGSSPYYFHNANGKLLFSAVTSDIGYALYVELRLEPGY